jgi:integrase
MKLTVQSAEALKLGRGERDRIWFDDAVPGFGLRVRETGSRSWIFQYKIGNKTRRLVIGQVSAIKLGRAREIASEYHAKVKLRQDPAAERRLQVQRASHTFGALALRYLEQQRSELRPGSYREIARHLEKYSAPLHRLPVDAVDQRTIAERLSGIEKNSGAVTSNRVRATMSAMFTWGMKEGLVLTNPVANTNKREEKARERVLVDSELRVIWQALGDNQYGTIVKLLMLTGQRLNEIAGFRWPEIDFDRGVISLPGSRTKNGRPHELPMASQVRALLSTQPRVDGRDLVFGKGEGPFSGFSRCKEALDNTIAELNGRPLARWRLHDLRRSVATGMAELGVQPHVIEAVLNHVSGHKGGIAGIYNRAQYSAEKAQALARWDEHINTIVRGCRPVVTPMRARV